MNDDGFSWFIEANGGKVEAAAPKKAREQKESKPIINGIVAIGWTMATDESHDYPTKGRSVTMRLMDREDVVFDGFKIKQLVPTGRYFGFILPQTFIDRLAREKDIVSIWEIYADGTSKKCK